MKYWEFLIQKEGDQTWLPLETQQVEILEGRYRVVAHTDRANTAMEIQVSQLITDELPPRKRVRNRTTQTNDSGLVMVVPYVHLKPGQWDLTCSSVNVMDDLMGDGWQYSVQLQVFAHTEEDWSAEWPVPSDSESAASVIIEDEDADELASDFNPDSPLLQAQAELESRLQEKQSRNGAQSATPVFAAFDSAGNATSSESYQITLRQQAYLAQHNLPMTIVGKVNSLTEIAPEDTSQLWIRLQNPETAQIIMEAHRPLSLARLPADFKVQIQLPTDVTTRVILGEVSLRTAAVDPGDTVNVLASTAFTITAGIAQLLDAIANQDADMFASIVEEDIAVLPKATQVSLFPQGSAEPAIAPPLPSPVQQNAVPAVGVVLPSRLDADHNAGAQPQLPNFPDKRANLIVSDGPSAVADEPEGVDAESIDAELANDVTAEMPPVVPPAAPPVTPPASLPVEYPIQRVPLVSQPAQFLGTSIEDSDLEADEIAAVLEDIDQDLRSEESDLDTLEPPGIEAALPSRLETESVRRSPSPSTSRSDRQDDSLFANGAEPNRRQQSINKSSDSQYSDRKSASGKSSAKPVEPNFDFQSLRLKDHFWDRLSSLTHDSHREATQLAKSMREAGVSRERSSSLPTAPAFSQNGLQSNEVVIYDEPATPYPAADKPGSEGSASVHSVRFCSFFSSRRIACRSAQS